MESPLKNLSLQFFIGKIEAHGTFFAISEQSPRFCVEGKTEDEVKKKALKAWTFYLKAKGRIAKPRVTKTDNFTSLKQCFVPQKVVTAQAC